MSKVTFTPGPWRYEDNASMTPDTPYWIGADHPEVGFCSHAHVRSGCDEAEELGDMEANARLIAAAPEIYEDASEALDLLLAHFGSVSDPSNVMLWSDEDAFRVYWNLHGSLAKARGEA
jgi:hypothetical protein